MPRESKKAKRERGVAFCARMGELYADVQSALDYSNPFELVICVLLSAQTTDAAVNKVTPRLFALWPTAEAMAAASPDEIGDVIRTIGFWRAKAAHCVGCAQMIVDDYGGEVPRTMDELVRLPGVGRKTANIVLNKAYGIVDGIAVDTHVYRIATRLKLTSAATPLAAERDILAVLPRELWGAVNEQWIHFGRDTCTAQRPKCDACPVVELCPSAFKANGNPKAKTKAKARGGRARA